MAKHIALSYSRLSTYEQCPYKFLSQYLDKSYPDEGENFHFVKGKKKHSQLENYIQCKIDPTMIDLRYDGDVQACFPMIDSLINSGYKLLAEQQLATTVNWEKCGWFAKETAWRAIADVIAVKDSEAIILDWKTGKFRDYDGKETGQLHLSSAVIFANFPDINSIVTAYVYIEHKQTVKRKFTREMFEDNLRDPFNKAFKVVNSDKDFQATRNQYCNWCLLNKSKEGICPIGM